MKSDSKIKLEISGVFGILKISCKEENRTLLFDNTQIKDQLENNDLKAVVIFLYGSSSSKINEFVKVSDEEKTKLIEILQTLLIPSITVISGYCGEFLFEVSLVSNMRIFCDNGKWILPAEGDDILSRIDLNYIMMKETGVLSNKKFDYAERIINAEKAYEYRLCNATYAEEGLEENTYNYLNQLLGNKKKKVIESIMKCFNIYKNLSITNSKEFDYEEEMNQLCILVYDDYLNSNNRSKNG